MTEIIERPMTPEEEAAREEWAKEAPARELAEIKELRRLGYVQFSDPIFFQFQRGERTEQDWKDAIAAVDALYPYPETPSE